MLVSIVSKIPIFPTHGGNRSRIKSLCDELRAMGHDLHFILLPSRSGERIDHASHVDYFGIGAFHTLKRRPIGSVPFLARTLTAREVGRFKPWSLSRRVDYRYDPALSKPIKTILRDISPDLLIVNYVHFSKILGLVDDKVTRVLDTHDSFSHEFTTAAESRGLDRADIILAIQDTEAERFSAMVSDKRKVRIVSHITPELPRVNVDDCIGATFFGSQFDANDVSLRWLVDQVLPRVLALQPTFKLVVAGTVGNAIDDHPAVFKLGKVDRLDEAYRLAPTLANAITKGTGIKIKLLEALAMGIPAVSTKLGVAGIGDTYLSGVTVIEDNDADAFARALIALQQDRQRRQANADKAIRSAQRWNAHQRANLADVLAQTRR